MFSQTSSFPSIPYTRSSETDYSRVNPTVYGPIIYGDWVCGCECVLGVRFPRLRKITKLTSKLDEWELEGVVNGEGRGVFFSRNVCTRVFTGSEYSSSLVSCLLSESL